MFHIGFMASGAGSNFQVILDRIAQGDLAGVSPEFLITNNSKSGAAEKARLAGIACYHISSVTHADSAALDQAMVDVVRKHGIELLVLVGYMKKVPDALLAALPDRVINVHPALLPSFGGPGLWGARVHEAVVQAGVRVSGPTIHFVDGDYDHGRIIAQRAVSIDSSESPEDVGAKVLQVEHDLYWRVIKAFAEGQVQIRDGKVICPVI